MRICGCVGAAAVANISPVRAVLCLAVLFFAAEILGVIEEVVDKR